MMSEKRQAHPKSPKLNREMLPIVDGRPPIFDKIVEKLPGAAEAGVMFAFDGKVWAPGRKTITRELDAHERVHIERQGDNPTKWWEQYLEDVSFRFYEELLAHEAEYAMFCQRFIDPVKRHVELQRIARKLASPLYGSLIRPGQAAILIRGGSGGQEIQVVP